jgi:hypothetical protein
MNSRALIKTGNKSNFEKRLALAISSAPKALKRLQIAVPVTLFWAIFLKQKYLNFDSWSNIDISIFFA